MPERIPYADHSLVPDALRKDILLEISRVMHLKSVEAHEAYVAATEAMLAGYFGTAATVAVDSGTTALQLTLTVLGIGPGDEVIVPAYTYIATAIAVTNIGAKPVFVDIKETDLTVDPAAVEAAITRRTKAVIPVHIHGLCCDMRSLRLLCKKHHLALVEDASQAHGAVVDGRKAGASGMGCFSLHMSKNLGALGDAGVVVLKSKTLARQIKGLLLPDHGDDAALQSRRTPCGMDAVQAAVIRKKLPFLDGVNQRKNQIVRLYAAAVSGTGIRTLVPLPGSEPAYRDGVIIVRNRKALSTYLSGKGIGTKSGYSPLYQFAAFKAGVRAKACPVAARIAACVLCLPLSSALTDSQVMFIADALRTYAKDGDG